MSHVEDAKLRVRSLETLEAVLAERFPHLELRRNQKTHAWWGLFVGDSTPPPGRDPRFYGQCEHAIGRKGHAPSNGPSGEWEIGLVPALDGDGYDMLLDSYGAAGQRLAREIPAMRREYNARAVTENAERKLGRQGYKVVREALPGNRIKLTVKKR